MTYPNSVMQPSLWEFSFMNQFPQILVTFELNDHRLFCFPKNERWQSWEVQLALSIFPTTDVHSMLSQSEAFPPQLWIVVNLLEPQQIIKDLKRCF